MIDWSKAPVWANYVYKTERSNWLFSKEKPYIKDGRWHIKTGRFSDAPNFDHLFDGSHLDSLMERPSRQGLIKHPHYHKPTNGVETVDVYWVLNAWGVQCHATGHAIKKLLNAGQRGVKPTRQDLEEAIDSIKRAIELLE